MTLFDGRHEDNKDNIEKNKCRDINNFVTNCMNIFCYCKSILKINNEFRTFDKFILFYLT